MEHHEQILASSLLRMAASEFGRHCSNDMDKSLTDHWTIAQRENFVREYGQYNGDPENWQTLKDFDRLPDFAFMGFLAYKLKQETV